MFSALQERNVGSLPTPLTFQQRSAASLDLVSRLNLEKTLDGHIGCVNTVAFNDSGSILVSGSDDQQVILWDYFSGRKLLGFRSGHTNNIFQARIMPHSNDRTVVTCAADGQVRLALLREGGTPQVSRLATHGSRAHKLALDPLSPSCFYSCGEDGRVFHMDLRARNARQSLLVCTKRGQGSLRDRLQLHSIHCNPLRPHQFVLGASDIYARVYDQRRSMSSSGGSEEPSPSPASLAEPVRSLAPNNLRRQDHMHRSSTGCHVTCAVFSQLGEIVATYNDENIYLFRSEGPAASAPAKRQPSVTEPALRKRTRSQPQDGVGVPPPQPPPATWPRRPFSNQNATASSRVAIEAAAEDARRDALRRIAFLRSGELAEGAEEAEAERPSPERQPGGDSAGSSFPGLQPSVPDAPIIAAADGISAQMASQAESGQRLRVNVGSHLGPLSQADNVAAFARPGGMYPGSQPSAPDALVIAAAERISAPTASQAESRRIRRWSRRNHLGHLSQADDAAAFARLGRLSPGLQPSAPDALIVAAAELIGGPTASQAESGQILSPGVGSQPGQADNVAVSARLMEIGSCGEAAGQGLQAMELGDGAEPAHSSEEAVCMPVDPDSVVQHEEGERSRRLEAISEDPSAGAPAVGNGEAAGQGSEQSESHSSEELDLELLDDSSSESQDWISRSWSEDSDDELDGMEEEYMGRGGLRALWEDMTEEQQNAIIMGSEGDRPYVHLADDELGVSEIDDEVVMTYTGHRNCRTVKGVSFLGESDEYVMSGSDDGHIYIWSKADGVLRQWFHGDTHVVNCLEPHPQLPMSFATSGIDDDIKLWGPSADTPMAVPLRATRIMERNRRSQRPNRAPMPPSADFILQRMRRFTASRPFMESGERLQAGDDAPESTHMEQALQLLGDALEVEDTDDDDDADADARGAGECVIG